ncbi:MAG: ribosome silencing factor [Maricaulaceae bacterium]
MKERIGTLSFDIVSARKDLPSPDAPTSAQALAAATRALDKLILTVLDDDKAQDVVLIDLEGKSSVTDTMIVATGRSHRHVGAVADHVVRRLKEAGYGRVQVEGLPACDWVLIDAGDAVLHLFRPEVRAFYNLEKMWLTPAVDDAEPPLTDPTPAEPSPAEPTQAAAH